MKFSVIVPVYNVGRWVRECLDSLKAQTCRDWEAICVDDGSTDGSGAVLDEYASADERFRVVHQANGGYGNAVNRGLAMARGEWVAIFESDDWVDGDFYERLLKKAEETHADVVKTGFCEFRDEDGSDGERTCFDEEAERGVLCAAEVPRMLSVHPSIWTCLYRREFIEREGIRMEESPGASWQDNLFQVKTVVKAKSIAFVTGCGYHYRVFRARRAPAPERILAVAEGVREWLEEAGEVDPIVSAAVSMRELSYVDLAFRLRHPFALLPIIRRAAKNLRTVPLERMESLGLLPGNGKSKYRWVTCGAFPGLLRMALGHVHGRFLDLMK